MPTSIYLTVQEYFQNRKRGGSAPRDASFVHERRARSAEMNHDGIDVMVVDYSPRKIHRKLTRCARCTWYRLSNIAVYSFLSMWTFLTAVKIDTHLLAGIVHDNCLAPYLCVSTWVDSL